MGTKQNTIWKVQDPTTYRFLGTTSYTLPLFTTAEQGDSSSLTGKCLFQKLPIMKHIGPAHAQEAQVCQGPQQPKESAASLLKEYTWTLLCPLRSS